MRITVYAKDVASKQGAGHGTAESRDIAEIVLFLAIAQARWVD